MNEVSRVRAMGRMGLLVLVTAILMLGGGVTADPALILAIFLLPLLISRVSFSNSVVCYGHFEPNSANLPYHPVRQVNRLLRI